jgi:biopolymer transport protein ExbD
MRPTLLMTVLFTVVTMWVGQSASSDENVNDLTIRVSADGICYFLDTSSPCDKLGSSLRSMHVAQKGHIHIAVDKFSKYEVVAATLESLQRAGFKRKIGFVNTEPSQ